MTGTAHDEVGWCPKCGVTQFRSAAVERSPWWCRGAAPCCVGCDSAWGLDIVQLRSEPAAPEVRRAAASFSASSTPPWMTQAASIARFIDDVESHANGATVARAWTSTAT